MKTKATNRTQHIIASPAAKSSHDGLPAHVIEEKKKRNADAAQRYRKRNANFEKLIKEAWDLSIIWVAAVKGADNIAPHIKSLADICELKHRQYDALLQEQTREPRMRLKRRDDKNLSYEGRTDFLEERDPTSKVLLEPPVCNSNFFE